MSQFPFKTKTQGEWKKEFSFSGFTSKDMIGYAEIFYLKFKDKLFSQTNFSSSFIEMQHQFRKTTVNNHSIPDLHDKAIGPHEESIANTSGKK